MNLRDILFFLQLSAYFVLNMSNGAPGNEKNNEPTPDESVMKAIQIALDKTISRLLREENDALKLTTLQKLQKHLRLRLRQADDYQASSDIPSLLSETVLGIIDESVDRNLREVLLQKSNVGKNGENANFSGIMNNRIGNGKKNSKTLPEKKNKANNEEKTYSAIESSGMRLLVASRIKGTRALNELLATNTNLNHFGVVNTREFPSGAVLFHFNSIEGKEALVQIVERSDKLRIELRDKFYPHSVFIQKLPLRLNITTEEVSKHIQEQFEETPLKVAFVITPQQKNPHTMDCAVHVSDALFEKMKANPRIQIAGRVYDIRTSVVVHRCFRCQLLGHTSKSCMSAPRPPPSENENCLDCRNYNQIIKDLELKDREPRDENHPTDHDECTTKKYLESLWRQRRGEKPTDGREESGETRTRAAKLGNVESSERAPSIESSDESRERRASEYFVHQSDFPEKEMIDVESSEQTSSTMLIAPAYTNKLRVLTELAIRGIDVAEFGVSRSVEFPSGAVLLVFDSVVRQNELKEIVNRSPSLVVQQKRQRRQSQPATVRIKNLSFAVRDDQVWSSVEYQFQEAPLKLSNIHCEDVAIEHLVRTILLHVTDTLLEKMKANPYIEIDGLLYHLDTSLYITRCFKCKLLGHAARRCMYPPRSFPSEFEGCIDCRFYNFQIQSLNIAGRELRDVNHPTGHENCLTKKYYEFSWRKRRSEEQVEIGEPIQEESRSEEPIEGKPRLEGHVAEVEESIRQELRSEEEVAAREVISEELRPETQVEVGELVQEESRSEEQVDELIEGKLRLEEQVAAKEADSEALRPGAQLEVGKSIREESRSEEEVAAQEVMPEELRPETQVELGESIQEESRLGEQVEEPIEEKLRSEEQVAAKEAISDALRPEAQLEVGESIREESRSEEVAAQEVMSEELRPEAQLEVGESIQEESRLGEQVEEPIEEKLRSKEQVAGKEAISDALRPEAQLEVGELIREESRSEEVAAQEVMSEELRPETQVEVGESIQEESRLGEQIEEPTEGKLRPEAQLEAGESIRGESRSEEPTEGKLGSEGHVAVKESIRQELRVEEELVAEEAISKALRPETQVEVREFVQEESRLREKVAAQEVMSEELRPETQVELGESIRGEPRSKEQVEEPIEGKLRSEDDVAVKESIRQELRLEEQVLAEEAASEELRPETQVEVEQPTEGKLMSEERLAAEEAMSEKLRPETQVEVTESIQKELREERLKERTERNLKSGEQALAEKGILEELRSETQVEVRESIQEESWLEEQVEEPTEVDLKTEDQVLAEEAISEELRPKTQVEIGESIQEGLRLEERVEESIEASLKSGEQVAAEEGILEELRSDTQLEVEESIREKSNSEEQVEKPIEGKLKSEKHSAAEESIVQVGVEESIRNESNSREQVEVGESILDELKVEERTELEESIPGEFNDSGVKKYSVLFEDLED